MNDHADSCLWRDIHAYYGSQNVPVDGDRIALMLRATGEPWTSDEIESATRSIYRIPSYAEFRGIALSKCPTELPGSDGQGARQALVDDYGNIINLTVAECKELVEAFKAIIQLRMVTGGDVQDAALPVEYFEHVLSSVGDTLPRRYLDTLMSQLHAYDGKITLRALLRLMSRNV